MVKTGTRHRFTGLNRWQRHSVTLAVAPALVLFVFMFLLIEIFQPELSDVIIRSSDEATIVVLTRWGVWLFLAPVAVFALMAGLLAVVGSPWVARGVRAIVAAERRRDYAAAAVSLGAAHGRLLFRHLLPAFILAEATLSYVGLGFAEPTPSWGSMLQEAANVQAIADFPWLLAPAAAIVMVVLWVNLIAETRGESDPLSLRVTVERRYRRV